MTSKIQNANINSLAKQSVSSGHYPYHISHSVLNYSKNSDPSQLEIIHVENRRPQAQYDYLNRDPKRRDQRDKGCIIF